MLLTNKGVHRSLDAGLSWQPLPVPWDDRYVKEHQQALLVTTA